MSGSHDGGVASPLYPTQCMEGNADIFSKAHKIPQFCQAMFPLYVVCVWTGERSYNFDHANIREEWEEFKLNVC